MGRLVRRGAIALCMALVVASCGAIDDAAGSELDSKLRAVHGQRVAERSGDAIRLSDGDGFAVGRCRQALREGIRTVCATCWDLPRGALRAGVHLRRRWG